MSAENDKFVVSSYTYNGLGLPVTIENATLIRGPTGWELDENLHELRRCVLRRIVNSESLPTGHELRFIRTWLMCTYTDFCEKLYKLFSLKVNKVTVASWELFGDETSSIDEESWEAIKNLVKRKISEKWNL